MAHLRLEREQVGRPVGLRVALRVSERQKKERLGGVCRLEQERPTARRRPPDVAASKRRDGGGVGPVREDQVHQVAALHLRPAEAD